MISDCPAPSVYLLVLRLERAATILVEAKGSHLFPAGFYVYVGSARKNILQRVGRHLRGTGKLRWHIDYLRRVAEPLGVLLLDASNYGECELARQVGMMPWASVPSRRFGASDCTCAAHLFHFDSLRPSELPHFEHNRWLAAE